MIKIIIRYVKKGLFTILSKILLTQIPKWGNIGEIIPNPH